MNWQRSKEKIQKNIYNRFIGSLKPLKNMFDLEFLGIPNTDLIAELNIFLKI
ncbi:MAG: hypothetical protein MRERC_2c134 [Mycoplasmataceae bacterium RC_NB112A]|nr:MAG: hypothetical protein MRERC_2c134 [Mycoplasmataceae bacterium RC_NB112A]